MTRVRLIAWDFNLGSLAATWKGHIAGMVLSRVDRFIVHASAEIRMYSQWLRLPENRFRFVPLQRGRIEPTKPSAISKPYIVSMGSANRDYDTLVRSVLGTGIKTVIVSKRETVDSLPEHPDLIKLHSLTPEECNSILQGAVLNVVPMSGIEAASGQVTFTTGMRMGIATITTRCVGTVDYIHDGETGLLVAPGDPHALRRAIRTLWDDVDLRDRVALTGRRYADAHFSDEAAGEYLAQAITEVL